MTLDLNKAGSQEKKDYGRVEDGSYPARIVSIIDIGRQHIKDWKVQKPQYHVLDDEGKWAKNGNNFLFTTEPDEQEQEHPDIKPQVMITYELPDETITFEKDDETEERPRWMSKEYTFSNHEKSGLMKLIGAVAPGITQLGDLLNKSCILSVGSTSTGNAKITGVSGPMKGMEVGELQNETVLFSFDESTAEDFANLQDWVKNKIRQAENFDKDKFEAENTSSTDSNEGFDDSDDPSPF